MAAFMRKKIPTFSPTTISGCQVWFDAADGSTVVAPNGPVLSWTSKGAAAMTATPSGTAPTYSKYNGFPGVAFNGTSTKMLTSTTASFGTTGSTWIAVSVNFSPVSSTLPPDASVVMATQGGTGPERAIRYDSTPLSTLYSIHTGVTRQDTGNNTNGIRGFIETAAAFNSYTNGTNTYTNNTAVTFQTSSNQGLVMGQWNIGWLNGFIFELLIYNRDLTVPEYQQVEAYLAQKWGYKDALPPGHPGTVGIIVPTLSKSIARPTLYYRNYQLTQIPGCLLWLDAADPAATGSVGTAITSWKDKSGNNNHFTLTSGTATVIQDGPYAVVGVPTGTLLTSTNTIATTANTTVFAVFKSTNTAYMMFLAFSGLLSGDLSIRCSSYVVPPGGTTTANDLFNGVTMYVDGNTSSSATMSGYHIVSGTMSTSGTTAVTISSTAFTSTRMFIGNAAEIVMYSGPLSTAQRQNVESYLADKWGLVPALPAGHSHTATPAGLPTSVPSAFHLIFALSKFMSQVFTLSTYSLANIANAVTSLSATPAYVWVASVPSGAKGKNGILAICFNMYSATQFIANQTFDYGVYVDGVSQFLGDSGTMRYIQTALGNYAIARNGISLGTNGIMGGTPLFFPLVLGPSASQIQIGIANSTLPMSPIVSVAPDNTNPTAYITPGQTTYTVPTTSSGSAVTGVFIYAWGCGGAPAGAAFPNGTSPGGAGGYASGYYSCSPGTQLTVICGGLATGAVATGNGGAGFQGAASGGGGFSGIFSSTNIVQSNTILIAGGGGGGSVNGYAQCGGGGGGISGTSWYNPSSGNYGEGGDGLGGLSNAVQGVNTGQAALQGGHTYGGGGGGWYGGGVGAFGSEHPGGGGSGYVGGYGVGIGVSASGVMSNGMTGTTAPIAVGAGSNIQAGGAAVMTAKGYSPNTYGHGGGGTGLVVLVPALGANPTQIGVSATLFSA
jgi:hypothetical protein